MTAHFDLTRRQLFRGLGATTACSVLPDCAGPAAAAVVPIIGTLLLTFAQGVVKGYGTALGEDLYRGEMPSWALEAIVRFKEKFGIEPHHGSFTRATSLSPRLSLLAGAAQSTNDVKLQANCMQYVHDRDDYWPIPMTAQLGMLALLRRDAGDRGRCVGPDGFPSEQKLRQFRSRYLLKSFDSIVNGEGNVDEPGEYWARTIGNETIKILWSPEPANTSRQSSIRAGIGEYARDLEDDPHQYVNARLWYDEVFAPVTLPLNAEQIGRR